jgi:hypothetical protein
MRRKVEIFSQFVINEPNLFSHTNYQGAHINISYQFYQ